MSSRPTDNSFCNSKYYALLKKILNRDLTILLCFPLLYSSTLEYFLKNHSKDCEERLWYLTLLKSRPQHCTTVLFTDYYSELNGYQGFTKEVLFCCCRHCRLRNNYTNIKNIPYLPPHTNSMWCCLQKEKFCVINIMEELFLKC